MRVRILHPRKSVFDGEARQVIVPGSEGSFGILDNHSAVLARLKAGKVVVDTMDGWNEFEISGGIIEVFSNQVTVLDF